MPKRLRMGQTSDAKYLIANYGLLNGKASPYDVDWVEVFRIRGAEHEQTDVASCRSERSAATTSTYRVGNAFQDRGHVA